MTGFSFRLRPARRLFQPLLPALLAATCLATILPACAQPASTDTTVVTLENREDSDTVRWLLAKFSRP